MGSLRYLIASTLTLSLLSNIVEAQEVIHEVDEFSSIPLEVQLIEDSAIKVQSTEPEIAQEEIKTTMSGLVIVENLSDLHAIEHSQIQGVYIDKSVSLPGSVALLQKKLEPLVLNKEINQQNLTLIKNEILKYYRSCQEHMVVAEIPEQDVTLGVVTFVVTQAKIGDVVYTGNRWYSKKRVEKRLDLHSGDCLDENKLLNNLSWLNENPFHYTEAIMSPGKEKGTSDLEIHTQDRFPLRVYTGADNTGLESTGRGRYYAGLTWGDAFFVDDLLSYQFISNSTFGRFNSHSLNYESFLPWKHSFTLYGGYARIRPDITDFDHTSKEAQASVRYRIPFKPLYTNFQHRLYFGFDYKYVTSALFFVGELNPPPEPANTQVNISQAMLGYQLECSPSKQQLTFRTELFCSPAQWLPHQSKDAFSSFRSHATPRYFYGTVALGDIYTFSTKDSISALFRAQGSLNTLIPSEQFKLGGYNTVRGYDESVFISDNGICLNLELRSRPFSFFKKVKDELTFLAFMDYGWGYNYHAFDGISKTAILWGVGPGARYTINPYLNMRVDYGFKLHHVGFDDNKLGMWHVSATLSY